MPSSMERRKRSRPYWYRSLSVFMTYASTVESTDAPLSEMENRLERTMAHEEEKDTFPSRRADSDAVSGLEELGLSDGVMHLRFEDLEEAALAYLLPGLWAPQYCLCVLAEGAALWGHCGDGDSQGPAH